MNLKDLSKTIANFAPLVGDILPIPGAETIGKLIAHLFGGNINDPSDLIERIKGDKDAAIKLAQFELQHKEELQKIALQHQIAIFDDRKNARERELSYIKLTGKVDTTLKVMAYAITLGFFACLFGLYIPNVSINEQERSLLLVLIGMLASKWQTIVDYFFGSSSKEKLNEHPDSPASLNKTIRK